MRIKNTLKKKKKSKKKKHLSKMMDSKKIRKLSHMKGKTMKKWSKAWAEGL